MISTTVVHFYTKILRIHVEVLFLHGPGSYLHVMSDAPLDRLRLLTTLLIAWLQKNLRTFPTLCSWRTALTCSLRSMCPSVFGLWQLTRMFAISLFGGCGPSLSPCSVAYGTGEEHLLRTSTTLASSSA